jgi:hypothetical protein
MNRMLADFMTEEDAIRINKLAFTENSSPVDDILKLPNIARPVMLFQFFIGPGGKGGHFFPQFSLQL